MKTKFARNVGLRRLYVNFNFLISRLGLCLTMVKRNATDQIRLKNLLAIFIFPLIYGAFILPAAATVATFNFDSNVVGTSTQFSDTNNGVTATFSSPADPGGFTVTTGFFSTLTGNVLYDPGPASANNIPLTIGFSQPISSISFLFALNDPSNTTSMGLSTDAGGSTSATGTIPAGFTFPEGSLSFSGAAFNSVTLSSAALDFAIDNVVVTTSTQVPLPATLPLFVGGLGALGLIRWRAKKKARALTA